MTRDPETIEWIVIGLMGLVTLFTRLAGVGLAGWIPETPFWQRFLNHLPATLLVAISVPAFLSGDFVLTAGAAVTLVVAAFGLQLVTCMAIGVGTVALLRLILS